MNLRNILITTFLSLFISACGTKYITQPPTLEDRPPLLSGGQPSATEPARPTIEPTATLPPPSPAQSLPAAVALRDQATAATNASDYTRAIGLLERALRISPNDPQTFYDLASNHLSTDQPQQALQLARRGLTLNPTNAQRDALEDLIARSQANL